tara:strand:- start:1189 stop:1497 length:309 start_codon:yes stop_codon:yes gene_type:complete
VSFKRPLETISFPDKPDYSTQFDANLDNSMALSFAFAKYVAVRSFKKCLKEDCTSKIKNTLIIPKIEDITFQATFVPCGNLATLIAIKAIITVSTLYMPSVI